MSLSPYRGKASIRRLVRAISDKVSVELTTRENELLLFTSYCHCCANVSSSLAVLNIARPDLE